MVNLKTRVLRKQGSPNFSKNEHFLPPDTHTYVCVSGGKKCSFLGKIGMLRFLANTRFEIRPFTLMGQSKNQAKWERNIKLWLLLPKFNSEKETGH